MAANVTSDYVTVDGLRLHYRGAGQGEPVLLLHGWPTSSFLWREVMQPIAERNRVLALDLVGFGQSDKPPEASYSFRFHHRMLDGFVEKLGIETTGLAVHDLGGPIGLYWLCQRPERVSKLALLNTIIYPDPSWAVIAFVLACRLPLARTLLASDWGLKLAMKIGIRDQRRITADLVAGVRAPFKTRNDRRALLKAGAALSPKGFHEIARKLPGFEGPVRIVYGERDAILPDVAQTMARAQRDLPQAKVTAIPNCGHFLQEDRPDEMGQILAAFFAPDGASPAP